MKKLAFFRSQQNNAGKKQNKNHKQGIGNSRTGEKIINIHSNLLFESNSLPFFRGSAESDIQKKKNNKKKSKSDQNIGVNFSKISHIAVLSSSQKAINKHNIAPATSIVNINLFQNNDRSEKLGNISAAPIQPAAKLVNKPESTFNLDLENNFINYHFNKGIIAMSML